MSSVDLSDPKVQASLEDVRDPSNKNRWVLLTHVKTTGKIKVEEEGETFEELIEELNDGKIMYALMRFEINNMFKYLFVSYCGGSIQNAPFKGKFQQFQRDVERELKGRFHLHVPARDEDDLNEKEIIEKLFKGTGSRYGSKGNTKNITVSDAKSSIKNQQQQSVQVTASSDKWKKEKLIDKNASDEYWSKQQVEQEKSAQEASKVASYKGDYNKKQESDSFWKKQNQENASDAPIENARAKEIEQLKNKSKSFWDEQQTQEPSDASSKNDELEQLKNRTNASSLKNKFEQMQVEDSVPPPKKAPPTFKPNKVTPPPFVQQQEQAPPQPQESFEEEEQQEEQEEEAPQVQQIQRPRVPSYVFKSKPLEEEPQEEEEPVPEPAKKLPPPPIPQPTQAEEDEEEEEEFEYAVALFEFFSEDPDELNFGEGDKLKILRKEGEWWFAELNGAQGFVPANYMDQ